MQDPELEAEIQVAAYFLANAGHSYEELCWMLAERQLKLEQSDVSEAQIRARSKEIFNAFNSYDNLCWLIAEVDVLKNKGYFDKTT